MSSLRRSRPGLRQIEDGDSYLDVRIGSTSDDNSIEISKA